MSVINTNIKSMVAQDALSVNNRTLSTAMQRLSTGSRINSAADDAAGLAISTRMDAQIRGLNMAIRNANDGISLMQTAEGALNEVTNMLQRMRELATQSLNGSYNDTDRKSLDAEVQQLKQEIDRVATTTQFNNQNILDGSYKNRVFQIGDKPDASLAVNISSVKTKDLGLGTGGGVADTLVSGRLSLGTAVAKGDIKINGQDVGAIASGDDMEDVIKAINDNVDNVQASGYNVVVAKQKGNGVTLDGKFQIEVKELGQGNATTFKISASNSMDELVANINNETGGVVKASINGDGKLVLANSTGATIKVTDQSASGAATFDGGSGFGGTTQQTFQGFLKLTSTDGSSIRVERGNVGDTAPGTDADLEVLGFREVTKETESDAYTVTGKELTAVTAWSKTDMKINGVEIYDEDIATSSFQGKLDAINNFSDKTGVVASAVFDKVFTVDTTKVTSGKNIVVNGHTATLTASTVADIVTQLNTLTDKTGIKATQQGNNVVLTGRNVQSITVSQDEDMLGVAGTSIGTSAVDYYGRIQLDSINNKPISIELGDSAAVAEHGFLETNVGAADYEVNAPTIGTGSGSAVAGVTVSTQAQANDAIKSLDAAIANVSAMRGDMGAVQNRLTHTINNLSNVVTNTSASRSRIQDTDYATETASLARAQIIQQAATAMLAQANQAPQSVLALLK